MSSDDGFSPKRSAYSPHRTADKPLPMEPLGSDAPLPADGAWHALLMGRTTEEIAAIIAQAGVILEGQGSSVPAQTCQQIVVVGAARVTVTRWTKATLAQFRRYALEPDAMVIRYGTQAIKSPVKGTHNDFSCLRPTPSSTEDPINVGGGGHHRKTFRACTGVNLLSKGEPRRGQVAGSGRKALSLKRR